METIQGIDPRTGKGLAVIIDGGVIVSVRPEQYAGGLFISPGLIDLQVNGFGGIDLNDGRVRPETVSDLCRLLLTRGVTRFLPTIITASEASMVSALGVIGAAVDADPLAAHMIAGIHVEGPFLSPEDGPRGAHPRRHIRPPDLAEVDRWQSACAGRVTMVTLSPHWPGVEKFIADLCQRGVHVAIGHTDASAAQIHAAADAGARLSTHLGNGAAAQIPRHPNFIWAQLADDRLAASFIADGHHLPADTLKALLRAKGLDRSVLVSDTAALGGMTPGFYDQPIGGQVELSADGRLSVAGTPYLAGAARSLDEDVALATAMAEIPLADALKMATANAGRFAGGRGVIEVGEAADIILFSFEPGDRRLTIADVWLRGERVSS
jgi:N-acetylglucosamine-6-phosphate deacetylase